jgi:hypothetical protein
MPRASRALLASWTLRGTMMTVPLNPPCKAIVQLMHSSKGLSNKIIFLGILSESKLEIKAIYNIYDVF